MKSQNEDEGLAEQLDGYAAALGLGHSQRRLQELEPQLTQLLTAIEDLQHVDVSNAEMALEYVQPAVSHQRQHRDQGS